MEKNQSRLKYKRGRRNREEQPGIGENQSELDKELVGAVGRGDAELVKEKIKRGANVNVRDPEWFHYTPLLVSSLYGLIGIVEALIEAHADADIKGGDDDTALHLSSLYGRIDIAKALIEAGADVNIKNGGDYTALHLSSLYGHIDIAKALIEAHADVNIKNGNDETALHLSLWNGHIDIVKALIEAHADVNIKNRDDYTALLLSIKNGHIDIAKALIEANADVNIKNRDDATALLLSLMIGHIDIVKALIEANADVNIKNQDSNTALHSVLNDKTRIDVVIALIKADNADLNIRDKNNNTYLHLSSVNGHIDIAKALIEANADVNIKNRNHNTALHLSSRNGHIAIVKALIEAHADVNIKDRDSNTAFHLVLNDETHIDIAIALIGADNADLNIRDKNNNTYLHLASFKGNSLIVQKLIECKADPNLKNDQGLKPVLLAALYGHTQIIRKLFNGGAKTDVNDPTEISLMHLVLMESAPTTLEFVITGEMHCNARGTNDRTVLHLAARLGCHEHMKCLLAISGIDINPKDKIGKTPLHCASEIGKTDTVIDLLKAGCKLHGLDERKKSVLHIASIYGHCELVKLFISEGLDPYQVDIFGRNCLHYAVWYRNEDVVRELLKAANNSKYNTMDSYGKTPRQYLHDCERSSLISRLLNGDSDGVEEFQLEEYHSFRPDISKCLHVSEISKTTHIGSVDAVKEHKMSSFIEYVKGEVCKIIRSAIPESDSVEVLGVGSSFEGTKNGLPDEFDFIIRLFHVASSSSGQEGYGKMQRDEKEVKRLNVIGSYGLWLWQKLMTYWSECEIKGETTRMVGERQFQMPLPPQRHPDRKTCTTWTWLYRDSVFKDLPVSIDFVPAIETDISDAKIRSTWAMTANEMRGRTCHTVPKIPHTTSALSTNFSVDEINQLGRVSYATLEVEHLDALEPRIKNVYITAKCLRKPEVCEFKIKNENGEVKAASEFVTSYRLKSVFLHLVLLFIKANLSLGKMVLMVYEQLEKCLERENLPMFFDPEVNVLAGSKLSTEESLSATRMMTRFVEALYERDFSSEIEKDSEEVAEAIEMERTAHARYKEEMRIYEQQMKEWNDKGRPWREEPETPNKPVLLNTYILENLQQIFSSETSSNADTHELLPKGGRQKIYVTEQPKRGEQGYDDINMKDWHTHHMRESRSDKEERDFSSEVEECTGGKARPSPHDVLGGLTEEIDEKQVVYDRQIRNDWIVSVPIEHRREPLTPYQRQAPSGAIDRRRSQNEVRDFAAEVNKFAQNDEDRLVSYNMLEKPTHAEEMIYEEEVVYDRKMINELIVSCQMENPHVSQEPEKASGTNDSCDNHECEDEEYGILAFSRTERQAHGEGMIYEKEAVYGWVANRLRKCRSDKEKRDFLSVVRECIDEQDRLLSSERPETTS